MADKTYVDVDTIDVKDPKSAFDGKYKSGLPKRMNAVFEKAINRSSKLTTKPPSDKKAEGFYLTGTLTLMKTDKSIEAKLSMVLATWPKKSMFGAANSEASTEVSNPDKIDKDVDAVIDALLDDAQTQVVKAFEKKAK
jgi:hypothetical protein